MLNNPFTSSTFVSIWSRFFNNDKDPITFKSFKDLSFYKTSIFPLYINIGKNITNGLNYGMDSEAIDFKGKVFLVHDVPTYFNLTKDQPARCKTKKVKQYKGLLADLKIDETLDDRLLRQFNAKHRSRYRNLKRRLESCFTVRYEVNYGDISTEHYNFLMEKFYGLLTKRYAGKQTMNYNLTDHFWQYYLELVRPMIEEKRASLFVIYNDDEPISMALNFHSKDVMFYLMPTFDINYSKFNLGHVTIVNMLQWGMEHDYKWFDFSKGDSQYKRKWYDEIYTFEHHVIYDSKSVMASILGNSVASYFKLKQYLRDKNLNSKLKDLAFKFRGRSNSQSKSSPIEISEFSESISLENIEVVPIQKAPSTIKKAVYDFLYSCSEHIDTVKLRYNASNKTYYLIGAKKKLAIKTS